MQKPVSKGNFAYPDDNRKRIIGYVFQDSWPQIKDLLPDPQIPSDLTTDQREALVQEMENAYHNEPNTAYKLHATLEPVLHHFYLVRKQSLPAGYIKSQHVALKEVYPDMTRKERRDFVSEMFAEIMPQVKIVDVTEISKSNIQTPEAK